MLDQVTAAGFDLSLTRSGVAVVGPGGIRCESFGRKGKRSESLRDRHERITALVGNLAGYLREQGELPQVATIEDNPFGTVGGSKHDRSGLWWMLYDRLAKLGIPVVEVNVAKVKIYATGRGSRLEKDDVLLATVRRHPDAPITNNDEADAVNLALIGARLAGYPYEVSLPQTHLRAMDGLEMPSHDGTPR